MGKLGGENVLVNLLFSSIWLKKGWQMNRLTFIETTTWMVLVWQIAAIHQIHPTFYPPNFPAI